MEVQLPRARQRAGRAGYVSSLLLLPYTPSMVNEMPTALPEWTTERPDVPGFYWWMESEEDAPVIVKLLKHGEGEGTVFYWDTPFGEGESVCDDINAPPGSLWWPVRLEHPPVG